MFAILIRREKNWCKRNCIENALISQFSMANLRPGSHTISPIITKAIVAQCCIQANREKNRDLLRVV